MRLFRKTLLAVFSCFLLIIIILSYILAINHVNDSENGLIEQNRIYGRLISKQIEIGYLQYDWPYELLNELSNRDDFIFWWVVKGDDTIYRSDDVSFMRTNVYDYFPQLKNRTDFDDTIYSNNEKNYEIYFKQFHYGSEIWTIWIGFSLDAIHQTSTNILVTVSISVISILILIFILLYMLMKSFTTPIVKLLKTVSEVGKGNFDVSSDIKSKDETGQLASEFNIMVKNLKDSRLKIEKYSKNLEKLLKQKDEFISQLSHDLKSPLNPLINLLPIIEKETENKKHREILCVVNRNVGYMKNLVKKSLKLAKLNAPSTKLKVEDVNLFDKINMTIKKNDNIFNNYNIKIKNNVSDKINIKADSLQIEELFDNIINNSIKYSPDGGTIAIDAKFENDFVNVSIKDEGNGMTPEQIVHVFDEFYKADWSRHDFDSSGLGLSICKRIVEKHGGRIWVESKGVGKGSTFYFNIPIENVSAEKNVSQEIDNFLYLRELKQKDKDQLNDI